LFQLETTPATSPNSALLISSVGQNTTGLLLPQFAPADSPLQQIATIPAPAYEGELLTITLPETISAVTSIQIGETTYTYSTNSTPQPGEYIYNSPTQELQIYPIAPISPTTSIEYVGLSLNHPSIRTDNIQGNYPDFLATWNAEGTVSFSRNFKGHPSCSMSFTTLARNESAVRSAFGGSASLSQLANGSFTILWGIGFHVQSLNVVRLSRRAYPAGLIGVTIQLDGCHAQKGQTVRSPLDKPIPLRSLDPQGAVGKTNLQALAQRAGTAYSGSLIEIEIPTGTPKTATTTVRSELESRAITVLGFPYYSNPYQVQVRPYGKTPIHFLSEADILSDQIPINTPGHGAYWDGIKVVEELNNALFSPATTEKDSDETTTICEGASRPEYAPQLRSLGSVTATQDDDQKNPTSFRDSAAFDQGGPTKEKTCTTYFNGQILYKTKVKYGFIYSYIDVYGIEYINNKAVAVYLEYMDSNPQKFWFKIEETKETYIYDSKTGDLLRIERKGFIKSRFKNETPNKPETVELAKQLKEGSFSGIDAAEKSKLEAEIALYQYPGKFVARNSFISLESDDGQRAVTLPVDDVTTNKLALMSDYYSDMKAEPGESPVAFVRSEIRRDYSYQLIPDPTGTKEEPKPPISTGKNFEETTTRIIIYPQPLGKQKPELFKEIHSTSNQEGSFLKRGLKITDEKEVKGRPPASIRLNRKSKQTRSGQSSNNNDLWKYIFSTYGSPLSPNDPEQGSISYPGITDPNIARKITEVDYSMRNAASETLSLKTFYKPEYNEGDLLAFSGHLYVIQGINASFKIERRHNRPRLICESFDLKLGRYMQFPVTMRQVKK
jgi:hypothetical protein